MIFSTNEATPQIYLFANVKQNCIQAILCSWIKVIQFESKSIVYANACMNLRIIFGHIALELRTNTRKTSLCSLLWLYWSPVSMNLFRLWYNSNEFHEVWLGVVLMCSHNCIEVAPMCIAVSGINKCSENKSICMLIDIGSSMNVVCDCHLPTHELFEPDSACGVINW